MTRFPEPTASGIGSLWLWEGFRPTPRLSESTAGQEKAGLTYGRACGNKRDGRHPTMVYEVVSRRQQTAPGGNRAWTPEASPLIRSTPEKTRASRHSKPGHRKRFETRQSATSSTRSSRIRFEIAPPTLAATLPMAVPLAPLSRPPDDCRKRGSTASKEVQLDHTGSSSQQSLGCPCGLRLVRRYFDVEEQLFLRPASGGIRLLPWLAEGAHEWLACPRFRRRATSKRVEIGDVRGR